MIKYPRIIYPMTYAEIIILATLMNRPRHGYDIKKVAENLFGDNITINNNTLYTNLHRFEEMDAVKSDVQHIAGKPDRHVYSITEKGKEIFREMILDFSPDLANNDEEFYARVAFFKTLEPEESLKIIKVRKSVLLDRLDRYEHICQSSSHIAEGYKDKVLLFLTNQMRNEIDWVNSLEADLLGK
jgi:DNA-binding PadR family transcriptional regulator